MTIRTIDLADFERVARALHEAGYTAADNAVRSAEFDRVVAPEPVLQIVAQRRRLLDEPAPAGPIRVVPSVAALKAKLG
jgi:TPP-dependent trihydroxycyclohexane-1,2-dione (THcHDO) dehydratase